MSTKLKISGMGKFLLKQNVVTNFIGRIIIGRMIKNYPANNYSAINKLTYSLLNSVKRLGTTYIAQVK